jgi:AcrR family transcriptional regulator
MDYGPVMSEDITGPQSVSARGCDVELPALRTAVPRERADAARNRAAVLDAAERLFREHGVDGVSMDAVAAAARVGKGTLFRRFGDRAGLAVALLDERERQLQEAILSGPAPLGPGRAAGTPTPAQRLGAFLDAYLDYVLAHLDLVRMSETGSPGARYRIGAYRFWHRHVAILLAGGSADPEADAHTVLAPLAAEHLRAMVAEVGVDRARRSVQRLGAALTRPGQSE